LRILVVNCQSIKNKKQELENLVETSKPDIMIGTESWLSNDIQSTEIFPSGFTPKLSRLKDVSVNVSLLFTLVMVDVSNICEERFGRPQMSQFQDMLLKHTSFVNTNMFEPLSRQDQSKTNCSNATNASVNANIQQPKSINQFPCKYPCGCVKYM
jgi:hypothetical protein